MYIDILRRLRDAIRRKRPEKWKTNSWFLHHDNAPAHRSVLGQEFLSKEHCDNTGSSPYSLLPWLQLIFTCFLE